jgi:hypothetical protein
MNAPLARHVIVVAGSHEWPARHAYAVREAVDAALDRHPDGVVELAVPADPQGAEMYAASYWDSFGGRVHHLAEQPTGDAGARATVTQVDGLPGGVTVELLAFPWGRCPRVRALVRRAGREGWPCSVLEGSELLGCSPPSARPGRWS